MKTKTLNVPSGKRNGQEKRQTARGNGQKKIATMEIELKPGLVMLNPDDIWGVPTCCLDFDHLQSL